MVREKAEVFVERRNGVGRLAAVDQRNSRAEHGIGPRSVGFGGVVERIGGGFPLLEISQTHAEVEVPGAVQRLEFNQLRVSLGSRLKVAHFILNVAERGVQRGISLTG